MTTEQNMLDALIQHQVYSYRASTAVVNELNGLFTKAMNQTATKLRELLDELTDAERDALLAGKYTTDTLKEIKSTFDELYTAVSITVPETFTVSAIALATYEAAYISKLYGEEIELNGSKVVAGIKKKPVMGGMLFDDVWKNLAESTRNKALYAVRQGIEQGNTTAQIVAELRGKRTRMPNSSYEYVGGIVDEVRRNGIEAAVRTIRSRVSQVAYEETFSTLGFDFVKDIATLDGRTSMQCKNRDGQIQKADDIKHRPPYHFNCLLDDSHVLTVGAVSGASKRWFDGEIIIIKTAKGRVLRCTPNHPILTSSGWVSSGLLDVGCDVICDLAGDWERFSVSNHKNAKSLIKNVVDSVFSSSKMITMPVPVSAKDFHYDGVGSKIAIVSSDSFLLSGTNASIKKHIPKHKFATRNPMVRSLFNSFSSFGKRFKGNLSSSGCLVGIKREFFNIFKACSLHSGKLLLRPASAFNSVFFKNRGSASNANIKMSGHSSDANAILKGIDNIGFTFSAFGKFINDMLFRSITNIFNFDISSNNIINRIYRKASLDGDVFLRHSINIKTGDDFACFWGANGTIDDFISEVRNNIGDNGLINTEFFSNKENRLTRFIGTDNIISIERDFFSGHVYNLETESGYYVANGIITHNCRTVQVGCDKDGKIDGKRPFVADTRSVKNIPKDERAGIIGQVNANTTYPQWFKNQSAAFQKEVLGPTKYDLYKKGGYTMDRFVDELGKPYTIAELRSLDEKTFKELGL